MCTCHVPLLRLDGWFVLHFRQCLIARNQLCELACWKFQSLRCCVSEPIWKHDDEIQETLVCSLVFGLRFLGGRCPFENRISFANRSAASSQSQLNVDVKSGEVKHPPGRTVPNICTLCSLHSSWLKLAVCSITRSVVAGHARGLIGRVNFQLWIEQINLNVPSASIAK